MFSVFVIDFYILVHVFVYSADTATFQKRWTLVRALDRPGRSRPHRRAWAPGHTQLASSRSQSLTLPTQRRFTRAAMAGDSNKWGSLAHKHPTKITTAHPRRPSLSMGAPPLAPRPARHNSRVTMVTSTDLICKVRTSSSHRAHQVATQTRASSSRPRHRPAHRECPLVGGRNNSRPCTRSPRRHPACSAICLAAPSRNATKILSAGIIPEWVHLARH